MISLQVTVTFKGFCFYFKVVKQNNEAVVGSVWNASAANRIRSHRVHLIKRIHHL